MITRETTMWKAWVGFNASDSYGAILFGAVYGYLFLAHSAFLFCGVGSWGGPCLSMAPYVTARRAMRAAPAARGR